MDISVIYSLDIKELWELFRSEIKDAISENKMQDERHAMMKILRAVKDGEEKEMQIDIRLIIAGDYKEYVKHDQVEIKRKMYNLYAFFDEVENRKDLMRKWLKVNWGNTGLGQTRTNEGGTDEKA